MKIVIYSMRLPSEKFHQFTEPPKDKRPLKKFFANTETKIDDLFLFVFLLVKL